MIGGARLDGERDLLKVQRHGLGRHGISAQQLFGWRRAARLRESERAAAVPDFAPVMLEAPARELRPPDGAVLEIVVGAMVARIPLTADGATLARIVRALRGAS